MTLFEWGKDAHHLDVTAQKLSWEAGTVILLGVVVFIGLHLFRRAFGPPVRKSEGAPLSESVQAVERYELGARLYHWGNFFVLALLLLSGGAFFFRGWLPSLKPFLGLTWLLAHEILAGIFIALLILHIIVSIFRTGLRSMWFGRGDGRDLAHHVRYYSGRSTALPKTGKYDVIQKIYHALLVVFAVVMIVTGISLFLNAETFTTLGHDWMRWQRILHDLFAFLFAAVILGHIYLRLLRPRWPALKSMFTGKLPREDFNARHDRHQWAPEAAGDTEDQRATGREADSKGGAG